MTCKTCGGSGWIAQKRTLDDGMGEVDSCPDCETSVETRTYWLSFADDTKPTGSQFLGVVILDVTQDDADEWIALFGWMYPHRQPDSEWVGAASRKAHKLGVNPGGQMLSANITRHVPPVPLIKNRLLSAQELAEAGLA